MSEHTAKLLHRRAMLTSLSTAMAAPMLASLALPVWAQVASKGDLAELSRVWRRQGGVLLIRHAATEAGLGDPPGFVLGQCSTQRNLSEAGRKASRGLGAWMQANGFKPDAVRSSQWCRCQDTARLAFGQYEDWSALNSTFAGQGDPVAQLQALRERLLAMPAGRTEVWVTHQVIMTGLTSAYPGLGEGFVVDRRGRLLVRGDLAT
jgi:phosphohistidine phosphatase SixA